MWSNTGTSFFDNWEEEEEEAPTDDAKNAFPSDLESPSPDRRAKNIFIFHDESTFNANEDEYLQWGTADSQLIQPKSRWVWNYGFRFHHWKGWLYLRLTKEEYKAAKGRNPNAWKAGWQLLEYGESCEGYWTADKFPKQMEIAMEVAEAKYPKEEWFCLFWIFDQSNCHTAFSEDALNANKMNARPGGKQPLMHDTMWNGRVQSMKKNVLVRGQQKWIPRGLIEILNERGCYHHKMKLEDMRKVIASHPNFVNEKSMLETFVNSHGHPFLFIPKYHCELNPIWVLLVPSKAPHLSLLQLLHNWPKTKHPWGIRSSYHRKHQELF